MTGIPPAPLPRPNLISADPNPPSAGQEVEFCYAFREGDPSPVVLQITWTLGGGKDSETITVSREAPCKKVAVPADAESVNVKDLSGTSGDYGAIVL